MWEDNENVLCCEDIYLNYEDTQKDEKESKQSW